MTSDLLSLIGTVFLWIYWPTFNGGLYFKYAPLAPPLTQTQRTHPPTRPTHPSSTHASTHTRPTTTKTPLFNPPPAPPHQIQPTCIHTLTPPHTPHPTPCCRSDPKYGNVCIANTVVALSASCIASFSLSGLMGGRFAPSHVQNATLAGGVAVGAIASLEMGLATAAVLGAVGGMISTLGYQKLQPFLYEKIGLHDRYLVVRE